MKQTGKHRVIVINLLVALALTLIVNFSFLLNGNDVRGHRPPPMMTMATRAASRIPVIHVGTPKFSSQALAMEF